MFSSSSHLRTGFQECVVEMSRASIPQPHTLACSRFRAVERVWKSVQNSPFSRARGREWSRILSMSHDGWGRGSSSRDQRAPLPHPMPEGHISLGMTAMSLKIGIYNWKYMVGVKRFHASVKKMRESHNPFSFYQFCFLRSLISKIYLFLILSFMTILT